MLVQENSGSSNAEAVVGWIEPEVLRSGNHTGVGTETIRAAAKEGPDNENGEYSTCFKDGACYCYCAYVLRISRYLGFLWVVPTNTGVFLRGLKVYRESRT